MSTPAGWYDDGSGGRRWWDGQRWTDQVQAVGSPPPRTSSHLWWALSPVYSCGTVSFIPVLHGAIKLRRRDLWLWAGGLIAGNIASWILILSGPSGAETELTPTQNVGTAIALVLTVTGTILAFLNRDAVFADSRGGGASLSPSVDPAVVSSLAARRRREESLALSSKDPGLARDLRIGRPDLSRQYDDGGLVDVNHVPAEVLVSHLGLSQDQARSVVEARDYVGEFTSTDDLSSLANIPPHLLDEIRDRVVVL